MDRWIRAGLGLRDLKLEPVGTLAAGALAGGQACPPECHSGLQLEPSISRHRSLAPAALYELQLVRCAGRLGRAGMPGLPAKRQELESITMEWPAWTIFTMPDSDISRYDRVTSRQVTVTVTRPRDHDSDAVLRLELPLKITIFFVGELILRAR